MDKLKELQRWTLITSLLDKVIQKGSWGGQVHWDMCIFFLQAMRGVPLGYSFYQGRYGPRPSKIESDWISLKARHIITNFARPYPYGPSLACTYRAECMLWHFYPVTLSKYIDDIDFVVEWFGDMNADELGSMSSAYYFILQDAELTDSEIAEKVLTWARYPVEVGLPAVKRVRQIAEQSRVS